MAGAGDRQAEGLLHHWLASDHQRLDLIRTKRELLKIADNSIQPGIERLDPSAGVLNLRRHLKIAPGLDERLTAPGNSSNLRQPLGKECLTCYLQRLGHAA